MTIKSKLSNFIVWILIVFLFILICFILFVRNLESVNFMYTDNLKFELEEPINICVKDDLGYKMIDYSVKKEDKLLNVISLYLGEKKHIDENNFIPSNLILDISEVYIKNNNIFIEYNFSQGSFNEETFKMLKITFKKLGYDNIFLQKL